MEQDIFPLKYYSNEMLHKEINDHGEVDQRASNNYPVIINKAKYPISISNRDF